ncbi:twin-arginine translocase TatA/TatE family subunit [Halosquirtibacter xylanolyticus]|nr:twin-arginine translocase TatA/TatE family subunit [Prolixibacteraceae bacterium]
MFGGQEIFIIALVILVLFGGKKIPELMRGVGKGLKEFKNETKEDDAEKKEDEKK